MTQRNSDEKHPMEGMFFCASGREYYRTGQLIQTVADGVFLAEFYPVDGTSAQAALPLELVEIYNMMEDDCDRWLFFRTKEAMNEWVEWVDRPDESKTELKVVPMARKSKE